MTEYALRKEIEYFKNRVIETTGGNKTAYGRARNCLRRRLRMLKALLAAGTLVHWTHFKLSDEEFETALKS